MKHCPHHTYINHYFNNSCCTTECAGCQVYPQEKPKSIDPKDNYGIINTKVVKKNKK